MNTTNGIERHLTRKEVAAILKVKPETVKTWHGTGRRRLPFFKINGVCRYRPSEVEKFIKEHTFATYAEHYEARNNLPENFPEGLESSQ